VISFSMRADPFSGVCHFCFFMDFIIYVIGVDQPWVAVLERKHRFLTVRFSSFILNISLISMKLL